MNAARSSRLLLVDDHENIRYTFGLALESDGYDVDTAGTAAEARKLVEKSAYDGLILDLRLGTESGLELLSALRSNGCDTPALMITAHGTMSEAVAAMKLGAVDFVEKPLQPITFRAAVARMLNGLTVKTAGEGTCDWQVTEARHAINCRDFATARFHLAHALELNSESADAHYLFGLLLERSNDAAKAERFYRRALQLYSEHSLTKAGDATRH